MATTNRKRRKSSNWLLYLLLALTVIAVGGLLMGKQMGWFGESGKIKVATEKVEKRTIVETVKASGKIYPSTEVKISPDVSGEVRTLNVEEGDTVKQGDLLAIIDADTYTSLVDKAKAAENSAKANLASISANVGTLEANVASAKANVAQVKARVKQAEAQVQKARADYERSEMLFNQQVISKVELDNTKTLYDSSFADLEAIKQNVVAAEQSVVAAQQNVSAALENVEGAKFSVESAKANVKESKDNLNKTNIYAPMSGIISVCNVKQGERVVGTLQMAGTEMMRIANFDNMEVQVDVSENDIVRVSKGDTAIIEVDAYTNRDFKGTVSSIASSAQGVGALISNDQVTNFTVKINIDDASYIDIIEKQKRIPFRPGMSASVEIETQKEQNILTVPIQAVTIRSESGDTLNTADDMEEVVFINNTSKAEKVKVETGIQDETYIQILNGLNEDQEIIAAPFRVINKKLKGEEDLEIVDKKDLYKDGKK